MYIAFDIQFEHISNYYELYLLRTQQGHHHENASSTVTESYIDENERFDDNDDELSDLDLDVA